MKTPPISQLISPRSTEWDIFTYSKSCEKREVDHNLKPIQRLKHWLTQELQKDSLIQKLTQCIKVINVNQLWIDLKSEALTEKGAKMTKRLIDSLNKRKVNLDSGEKGFKNWLTKYLWIFVLAQKIQKYDSLNDKRVYLSSSKKSHWSKHWLAEWGGRESVLNWFIDWSIDWHRSDSQL